MMLVKKMIKYPNPTITKTKVHRIESHGMLFENALNLSNDYYRIHDIAIIYKKPTPVQIVKVDYPSRNKARITEGYFKTPSTTDYNGVYRGKYIDYEAKETNNLSFSFKHIFKHQIEHLQNVNKHQGIAFIIIFFKKIGEIYIIDITTFARYYNDPTVKSLTLKAIKEDGIGHRVNTGYTPPIDYIKVIDEMYF